MTTNEMTYQESVTQKHPYMKRENPYIERDPYFRSWVENKLPVGESVETDIVIYESELREDVRRINSGSKLIYLVGEDKYNGQVPHIHKVYQFERRQLRLITVMFFACPSIAMLVVMMLSKPDAKGLAILGAGVTAILLTTFGTLFLSLFLKKELIDNTPYLARQTEKEREQLKKDFTIVSYK